MAEENSWSVQNPDAKDTVLRIIETDLGNSGYELPEGEQLETLNAIVDNTLVIALNSFNCPLPNKGQNNQPCPTIANQSGYERRRVQEFCHEHNPCDARDIAHMCWIEIFGPRGLKLEYA